MSSEIALAIAIAGYGVMLVALAIAAQPLRRRLFMLGKAMLNETSWTPQDRNDVRRVLATSTSFWAGPLLVVAAISLMAESILGRHKPIAVSQLDYDPRTPRFFTYAVLSLILANPIPALVWVPALAAIGLASSFAHWSSGRSAVLETVEDSLRRASARFTPATC